MADFPSRALLKGLITHLKANMPSLAEAYDDFPNPNQKLKYPCLSIFAKAPEYQPMMPYVVGKGSVIVGGPDDGKVPVRKVMGAFEYKLQIDLWADSKPARAKIESELLGAFSKDPSVAGISLQLADYFNEWVRFDITSFDYPDSGEASQRSEWRTLITVLASCKHIAETNAFVIETIENNLETPDSIASVDEDDVTTII